MANPSVSRWSPLVKKSAKRWHLPPSLLLAQIDQESGGNPSSVSPAGAFGLTQFIPSTAASYGVKPGTGRREVESQIEGQARYMSNLVREYKGNYHDALEAYNAGRAGTGLSEPQQYAKSILGKTGEYSHTKDVFNLTEIPEWGLKGPQKLGEELGKGLMGEGTNIPGSPSLNPFSALEEIGALFTNIFVWVRVGEGIVGLVLILAALKTLSHKYEASRVVVGQSREGRMTARTGTHLVKKAVEVAAVAE